MKKRKTTVAAKIMRETYEKLKTPYKYGAVMKFEDRFCDSPSLFCQGGVYYLSFIQINRNTSDSGYESYLAKSVDLLHWEILFPIMERTEDDCWDSKQRAAYAAFVDNDLFGNYEIRRVNGHFYFSYLGGNLNGYDVETVFLAVSDDGEHWTRYLDRAVFAEPDAKITGDPLILRYDGLYIMIYFVLKNDVTYNTFAASYDLVNWTRWEGKPLIESEYQWEGVYAHKSALIRRGGVLYHFYCAVNSKNERFIALAASEKVW